MMMGRQIYVSTNCFVQKDLRDILSCAADQGLRSIELSGCHADGLNVQEVLMDNIQRHSTRFLVHNYFPPPRIPFVLNLASNDPVILDLSREHCRRAIDICAAVRAPFYSVHSGFCYHATPEQLGRKTQRFDAFPKETGHKIFIESLQTLSQYAQQRNIKLAIENNVLPSYALVDGRNELLLGVSGDDLSQVMADAGHDNLFFLIDVGHLQVASHTLGFSASEFIRGLSPRTIALHLNDNNTRTDEHLAVSDGSWFWPAVNQYLSTDIYLVIESRPQSTAQIAEQIQLVDTLFERGKIKNK